MTPESHSITLQVAEGRSLALALGLESWSGDHLDEVVGEVADKAMHSAFSTIADEVGELSGDFSPNEVADLERVFGLFVRAMCVNTRRTPTPDQEREEVAEYLETLADLDEGDHVDIDRVRDLAEKVRRTGYNVGEGSAILAERVEGEGRRHAVVRGATSAEEVAAYLPSNYFVTGEVVVEGDRSVGFLVCGRDVAGWTLDAYVIPRLASGLLVAEEVAR